jgi:hypothetical protein
MKIKILCFLILLLTGCMQNHRAWVEDKDRYHTIYGYGSVNVKITNQTKNEYDVEIDGVYVLKDFEYKHHLKPNEHINLVLDVGSYLVCFDRGFFYLNSCVQKIVYGKDDQIEWNTIEDNSGGDPVRMGLDIMSIFFR